MPHPPPIQEVGGAWPCEDGTCWTRRGQTWLTWWPGPGKVEAVSSGALTGRWGTRNSVVQPQTRCGLGCGCPDSGMGGGRGHLTGS